MTTNTISNQDDTIDSRDVIARIEELKDQITDRWLAGWNMPGFMPDSEPAEFDNFTDAQHYIADEIDRLADEMDERNDEELATTLRKDANTVRYMTDEQDFGATLCDYHYWITKDGQMGLDEDELEELKALEELAEEAEGYLDYGAQLIRYSYFKEYAMELAEDIGAINSEASWPNNCIDWNQAARELRMDYTSVEFDGVTYWVR